MIINNTIFFEEIKQHGEGAYLMRNRFNSFSNILCKLIPHAKEKYIDLNFIKDNGELLIYFDGGIRDPYYLNYISNLHLKRKLIFYYWNPVNKSINPQYIPNSFEKWSYSPTDCSKYNMRYNSPFYFDEFTKNLPATAPEKDVFFYGKEKGRYNKLMYFKKVFESNNLSTDFNIVSNRSFAFSSKYAKRISYKDLVKKINKANCIFDYYNDEQAGLSLRPMEALFFGKKLITNNKTIKNYNFFNESNIFILGERNENELQSFLHEPLVYISENIKKMYLFDNWLKRFYQ